MITTILRKFTTLITHLDLTAKKIDIYRSVAEPFIADVLAGYTCTLFAFGQSGTGKSYAMEGERTPGDANSWELVISLFFAHVKYFYLHGHILGPPLWASAEGYKQNI